MRSVFWQIIRRADNNPSNYTSICYALVWEPWTNNEVGTSKVMWTAYARCIICQLLNSGSENVVCQEKDKEIREYRHGFVASYCLEFRNHRHSCRLGGHHDVNTLSNRVGSFVFVLSALTCMDRRVAKAPSSFCLMQVLFMWFARTSFRIEIPSTAQSMHGTFVLSVWFFGRSYQVIDNSNLVSLSENNPLYIV